MTELLREPSEANGTGQAPLPPADASLASEMCVVGSLMIAGPEDRDAVERALVLLDSSHFASPRNRTLYRTLSGLRANGDPADPSTVLQALADAGELEEAGGLDYVAEILDGVVTAANVEYHARIVVEKAMLRRTRKALQRALDTLDEPGKVGDLLEGVGAAVDSARAQVQSHDGKRVVSLAEIVRDPELLQPPETVVPRLAWRGRVTLLAAREKAGKSTLLSAAAAAKSAGHRFLGDVPAPGRVLYLPLEEHVGDVAQRLISFQAAAELVWLMQAPLDPFAELEGAVATVEPELVIIDTLAAFTERMDLDPGKSTDWTPIMARFERIARGTGAAVIILHHARKSDGKYRDSSAIGARVDMILEMGEDEDVPGVRKIKAKGRWTVEDYAVHYVEPDGEGLAGYFQLASGELGLDARIISWVQHDPGASKRSLRDNVRGNSQQIDSAIFRLLQSRVIEDRGSERRAAYFLSVENREHGPGHAMSTVQSTPGSTSENGGVTKSVTINSRLPGEDTQDDLPF